MDGYITPPSTPFSSTNTTYTTYAREYHTPAKHRTSICSLHPSVQQEAQTPRMPKLLFTSKPPTNEYITLLILQTRMVLLTSKPSTNGYHPSHPTEATTHQQTINERYVLPFSPYRGSRELTSKPSTQLPFSPYRSCYSPANHNLRMNIYPSHPTEALTHQQTIYGQVLPTDTHAHLLDPQGTRTAVAGVAQLIAFVSLALETSAGDRRRPRQTNTL